MMTAKEKNALERSERRAQKKRAEARFVNLDSILGNTWAIFFGLIGSRMTGKSYAVAERICKLKKRYGDGVKVYWMRISDTSTKALLLNKADKLIDPDLKRKYNLDLSTKGNIVFDHGKPFCEVYPLVQFGKLKGVGFYDKDYQGRYVIVLDEFQLEQGEKRTSFDILYNFIGMCENIARTTKEKIEVWLLGNTLEEASTILKAFDFLPEKFGRFYLRRKRCVIDNMEPTEEYLRDRAGSIADILGGKAMSNYSNDLHKDATLIDKRRAVRPDGIIKFFKDPQSWFVLWNGKLIKRYKKQPLPKERDYCMRPYIDSYYSKDRRQVILDMFDARALRFDSLITLAYFQDYLKTMRKT